ncbi:MAG: hypothetical protein MUF12_02005 [Sediminibacterium sp.]|jgi:hypothetical protein|nr:hypothetical protein [Sediminibacterium sp.]
MKLYIAVLDEFPDYMVPTLVAHAVLGAHASHSGCEDYDRWYQTSFKKCVVRVNQKEFDKICALHGTYIGFEKKTLDGKPSCAIPIPCENDVLPNVLKFAKLWAPGQMKPAPINGNPCWEIKANE